MLPEQRRRDDEQRQDRHHRERQPPVEQEQDDRRADQRQRVLDQAGEPVRDELVERLDVVREAADDHARAVALVEAEGEPLQVAEEARAEVGEDPLADPAREVGLRVGHPPACDARGEEEGDDDVEPRRGAAVDGVVERVLGEERRR